MVYTPGDIAKLSNFFNAQQGNIDGTQILDTSMLAQCMQRSNPPKGLEPKSNRRYKTGFWAVDLASIGVCASTRYAPFMSGYSGISVIMLSNGANYYYFSDGNDFVYDVSAREAAKLGSAC